VYRGKLDAPGPNAVAEHDLVSEVYYIMSGSGTLVLGPDITNLKRRAGDAETVRLFNGPGNNGSAIRNGKTYNLKAWRHGRHPGRYRASVHQIEDHLSYVMVRIDPDKVTPLMDEAKSRTWLATPRTPVPTAISAFGLTKSPVRGSRSAAPTAILAFGNSLGDALRERAMSKFNTALLAGSMFTTLLCAGIAWAAADANNFRT
jgi:hypothetical protein